MRGSVQKRSKAVDLDHVLDDLLGNKNGAMNALELQLIEVSAANFPFLVDHTLAEAKLRQHTGLTLIALTRKDGGVFDNPGGDFRVESGDSLVLIGTEEHIKELEKMGASAS